MFYEVGEDLTFAWVAYDVLGHGFQPDTAVVNILAPDGTLVVSAGSPTYRSYGVHVYTLDGANNDQAGLWVGMLCITDVDGDILDIPDWHQVRPAGEGFVGLLAQMVNYGMPGLVEAVRDLKYNGQTLDFGPGLKIYHDGKTTSITT